MIPINVTRTLAEEVATLLRAAILEGRLHPGERLREDNLAELLGVSRGPVHKALSQLEREGLVIVNRNRRAFVARLSREDLEEVYSLRLALEVLAVQQAIRRPGNAQALDEMQQVIDRTAQKYDNDLTEQEAAELDLQFHDALCRASGHKRLMACWSTLRAQVHVFLLSRNVADRDFRTFAIGSHQAILNAIVDRDEARAIALIRAHSQGSYQRLLKSYEGAADAAPAAAAVLVSDRRP